MRINNKRDLKYWIMMVLLAVLLGGCQSAPWGENERGFLDWKYADLRLLDPSDTELPDQDLIALYTRFTDQSFQVRLDFLGSSLPVNMDIYIAIDAHPGSKAQVLASELDPIRTEIPWDYLIKLPASGKNEIVDHQSSPISGTQLLVVRNTPRDSIILNINQNDLRIRWSNAHLQAIITRPNSNFIIDKSEPISIDTSSPARIQVIFAFWNTFTANTPAQTLRSWAGAHSGPMRSRHGLKYLLDAAQQTNSSVVLFDLVQPEILSALDYVHALPQVKQMADKGYLGLVNTLNQDKSDVSIIRNNISFDNIFINFRQEAYTNEIGSEKVESNTDFILLLNNMFIVNNRIFEFGDNDYAHYSGIKCPLFTNANTTSYDVSVIFDIDCKKFLLEIALQQPTPLLVVGGDFANSWFGEPTIVNDIFAYISEHPWIQTNTFDDILIYKAVFPPPSQLLTTITQRKNETAEFDNNSTKQAAIIRQALDKSPNNQITTLAWQVYTLLTSRAAKDLSTLKSNYIGQLGQLVEAAAWADNPRMINACDKDIDYDGMNECLLSNNNIFIVVDPDGGYIPFAFGIDSHGIHQIIGPSWEFIVGLSDPSAWTPSMGLRSDADQYLGAVVDDFDSWNIYGIVSDKNNKITLDNAQMSIRKSVYIYPNRLLIDIQTQTTRLTPLSIPLVIDPWARFTPGWGELYTADQTPFAFQWGLSSSFRIEVSSTNHIQAYPFNETRTFMQSPEDPNYAYPRGHYLPYPIALVEIEPSENLSIDIHFTP